MRVDLLRTPSQITTRRVVVATPDGKGSSDLPGIKVSLPFEHATGVIGAAFCRRWDDMHHWPTRVCLVTSDVVFSPDPTPDQLLDWATAGTSPQGGRLRKTDVRVTDFGEDNELVLVSGHDPDRVYGIFSLGIWE